jgi:hypothetical protein
MQKVSSFILHLDSLDILEDMDDKMAGKFIKAIYCYQSTRSLPKLDLSIKLAIKPFLQQFERDHKKYNDSVKMGKIGNLKKYHKEIYNKLKAGHIDLEQAERLAYPDKNIISRPPIAPEKANKTDELQSKAENNFSPPITSYNDNDNDNDNIIKKTKAKKDFFDFDIPNFIEKKNLEDFIENRKAIKKPVTKYAMKRLLTQLEKLHKEGENVNECLNQSIVNGWTGVFSVKKNIKRDNNFSNYQNAGYDPAKGRQRIDDILKNYENEQRGNYEN